MNIIKRHGMKEKFDERKLYASIYSAAITSGYPEKKAENLADEVCSKIKKKYGKHVVTSLDLRKAAISILKNKDKDIAFLYETHLDLS